MNELMTFANAEFGNVRALEKDGEPWFVLTDVCRVLEIANNRNIAARLDDDEKGVQLVDTLGGPQEMTIVSEAGLYKVILRSDKPKAKPFMRWVTHDVLPSIRKHGGYIMGQESLSDDELLARAFVVAQNKLREREARVAALQIELDESKDWFSIKRVAAMNHKHWKKYNWSKLKKCSQAMGLGPRKIFDANYGEVNVYHKDVWEVVYPEAEL